MKPPTEHLRVRWTEKLSAFLYCLHSNRQTNQRSVFFKWCKWISNFIMLSLHSQHVFLRYSSLPNFDIYTTNVSCNININILSHNFIKMMVFSQLKFLVNTLAVLFDHTTPQIYITFPSLTQSVGNLWLQMFTKGNVPCGRTIVIALNFVYTHRLHTIRLWHEYVQFE